MVGARLGGGVGTAGAVRRVLGEPLRVVELEVAVHLVGGDVVEPHVGLAHRLEDVKVPTRLVRMNGSGSSSELSLWDSAAKCTTASCAATSGSTTAPSATSPTTSSTRSVGSPASASGLAA